MKLLKRQILVLFLLACILVSAGCISEKPVADEESSSLADEVIGTAAGEQAGNLRDAPSEVLIQKEYIASKVRDAAAIIEEKGEESFSEFRQPESEWFMDDFYIFVWKTDGTRLVYPPDTSGEGENMSGLQDSMGKPVGRLFIETALNDGGEGWVSYYWPKPGETEPSLKYAFIRGVSPDGEDCLVGSGFYADDYILTKNLDECEHFSREGNIYITNLFHPDLYDRDVHLNYSIAHTILASGEALAPHRMKNPEIHYVLEGEGVIYIEDLPVDLRPGEMVYIPANATQSTHNTGSVNFTFLAINEPAWRVENEEILE
ncbi:cache domain-containing protein [Methanosarcina sp. T3]|uniref:cache domain-containing protein n=1 Tax=Methanosarcina sp. T3 TaxID=3439062 RepID=UPI003F85F585